MSHLLEQDRTGFFTVVGAPYVAEQHDDTPSHYHQYSDEGAKGVGMATLWLAFYAVIVGVTVLSKVGAVGVGRAVEMTAALIK
jgi:hypothetical protein